MVRKSTIFMACVLITTFAHAKLIDRNFQRFNNLKYIAILQKNIFQNLNSQYLFDETKDGLTTTRIYKIYQNGVTLEATHVSKEEIFGLYSDNNWVECKVSKDDKRALWFGENSIQSIKNQKSCIEYFIIASFLNSLSVQQLIDDYFEHLFIKKDAPVVDAYPPYWKSIASDRIKNGSMRGYSINGIKIFVNYGYADQGYFYGVLVDSNDNLIQYPRSGISKIFPFSPHLNDTYGVFLDEYFERNGKAFVRLFVEKAFTASFYALK